MNTAIAIAIGIVFYAAAMWLLLAIMRLERTRDEGEEDGADSERRAREIVQASQPAPLSWDDAYITHIKRPRVRAGVER